MMSGGIFVDVFRYWFGARSDIEGRLCDDCGRRSRLGFWRLMVTNSFSRCGSVAKAMLSTADAKRDIACFVSSVPGCCHRGTP